MALKIISVTGDHTTHTGSLITASGVKLVVSGKRVTVTGDPSPDTLTTPNPAIHLASHTIAPGTRKLKVSGRFVNAIGDSCTCTSTITGPGGIKLKVT